MGNGRVIDTRYTLGDLLGEGGMGSVYGAVDRQTGETVAVKQLKPEIVRSDPGMVERFAREGQVLRDLNHPNIVKVLATVEEDGQHYIIMEHVSTILSIT